MSFVGIDLGTTNSLVAIKRPQRKVKVFNIKSEIDVSLEEEARFYLPSAVSFVNGQHLIGWEVVANPEQEERIFSIKRLMGRGYDDRDPKKGFLIRDKIRETWGYKIRKPPKGTGEDMEVKLGEDWVTPQEVSALILRRLKEIVELDGDAVEGAVITVPAYFNDKQKWATREAARLAGLNVQMILDEPTAAAIAYGMETLGAEPRTVAVYDFGGGTFDISLLEIEGTNFRVAAIDGNNWLGGDDLDDEIVKLVLEEAGEKYAEKLREDQVKKNILKQRAKEAKESLSVELETPIIIGDLIPDVEKIDLTRDKFEQTISHHVSETIELIDSVLREKSLTEDDIDKVLLVGGSTRIPLVRRRLAQKFGEGKIVGEINPMLCVTAGASIKSSWLLDRWECPKCRNLNEKRNIKCNKCDHPLPQTKSSTERPYGIKIYDREKQKHIFDVLIPLYTLYPLKESKKRIYDIRNTDARLLKIHFFAGEKSDKKPYHDEIEENTHLGTIWILLPKGISTNDKVEIYYNLDNSGILDLGSISITLSGKPIEKKTIIRRGEEENIGNEIEKMLNDISKVSNPDKREESVGSAFGLFEKLFECGNVSDKQIKEGKIREIQNQIGKLKGEIKNGNGRPPEPDVIQAAKNLILNSYYIEEEYGWLPFMKNELRREEIRRVRKKLEDAITNEKITQKDEWDIMLLIMQLTVQLSDESFKLLREIEISAEIAEKGKKANVGRITTDLEKGIKEKIGLKESTFEKRSPSERIDDAEKLKAAYVKIKKLLQLGKVEEAKEEYLEISPLVIYYLSEFFKGTGGRS